MVSKTACAFLSDSWITDTNSSASYWEELRQVLVQLDLHHVGASPVCPLGFLIETIFKELLDYVCEYIPIVLCVNR